MDSPLLFPVSLTENTIQVLDETKIPYTCEYITVKTLDDALGVLGQMKTRSLGQVLLFFYCCVLFENSCASDEIAGKFQKTRPTFDFLFLNGLIKRYRASGAPLDKIVSGFITNFDRARKLRATTLAGLLPQEAHILTICNVNGELLYLAEALESSGKHVSYYVCETRPYLQGSRITFWELRKNNLSCYLLCDNQAALLMKKQKVNCVVVGADRATKTGDIINKTGTYALGCLARHFNIPFYALTQYPRDIDVNSIEIEERPPREVFSYIEKWSNGQDAVYPAFDVVPGRLITKSLELPMKQ
ncbi:MAG: hypothetical protein JXD21_01810 [Candidatus Omnitrophica bacterium]|nr:hypothetical protein [Candidatus Omnitrophota bacterium]